ncbi:cytochrome P460 family protein [Sphingomonas alpina]|uniref:Cytochrome P460 family protein n=1 Tax=Sphingomonas alpina TaxID=653931 RepID=A0A7H0LJV2_9SPHN|nr:cytochrome P460 family protein [Sphingomonas alpina]QNQ09955.1 cytochrome P460 family protein [Sphingomonas alpina]
MKLLGIIALAAVATVATARSTQEPEIAYPANFRKWQHISSGYIGEGNPGFPRYGGIHYIYANDRAMTGYRTGTFPLGSVLVFDVHDVKTGPGTIDPTTRKLVDVMEKRHGGWRFVEFDGDSRTKISVTGDQAVKVCAACHETAKRDHVFSNFVDP